MGLTQEPKIKAKQKSVYKKLGILLIYDSKAFPSEAQTCESDILVF